MEELQVELLRQLTQMRIDLNIVKIELQKLKDEINKEPAVYINCAGSVEIN